MISVKELTMASFGSMLWKNVLWRVYTSSHSKAGTWK